MKKQNRDKIIVGAIIGLFIFSAWMFNEKEEKEVGEQGVYPHTATIVEYQLINEYATTFKCRFYINYCLVYNTGYSESPTWRGIKYIPVTNVQIFPTNQYNSPENINVSGHVKWDGSRTYIEVTLPQRSNSIFIGLVGFDSCSLQSMNPVGQIFDVYNRNMNTYCDGVNVRIRPSGVSIGKDSNSFFEITPAMMHKIQQATISNFQQLPIDLTHEKVTFNTNVACTPKYYLKIGGSWHLQDTGANTTDHNHTFIVSEYTSTPYKIELYDLYGRKLDTEKTGIIRTVGPEICGDGIDNDNDGLTDWDDSECVKVTITKTSENIGTTTYYGIFSITGDAEAYIEYQKGSGQVKKVNLTKVGQDYVLSLENLDPNSGYNGRIYAKDINFPENNDEIPLTFTTLQEGGIIEITETGVTTDSFNCKFTINADTINTLTFTYRTSSGSINEVDPNDQGNNNYAVEITNLSAGDYEYIIETSTDRGDDSYEGSFTIAEAPPETTTPPPVSTLPPTTIPPSPQETDYTMIFLVLVVLVLAGGLIYTTKFKKKRRR